MHGATGGHYEDLTIHTHMHAHMHTHTHKHTHTYTHTHTHTHTHIHTHTHTEENMTSTCHCSEHVACVLPHRWTLRRPHQPPGCRGKQRPTEAGKASGRPFRWWCCVQCGHWAWVRGHRVRGPGARVRGHAATRVLLPETNVHRSVGGSLRHHHSHHRHRHGSW